MPTLTATPSTAPSAHLLTPGRVRIFALPEMRWAAAALALFLAGLAAQLAGEPAWLFWPLYLACYAAGGWEPGLAGLRALREKTLDVDLLMVAAAIGAAAIGQVMDGALLIVIFATSGALEALATARTEDSVRGLLGLAPETATRVAADGAEETVSVAGLAVGEVVLVRPGERVPADGTVLDGGSEVDQATITGEPLPVGKAPGDDVFAGTLNGTGVLCVRVDRPAGDSVVARIAALVEEASRTKARTQLFVEKVEQRYALGMVTATVLLFAVPLLLGSPLREALLRAMTFMIVASPCAVVLATMPPLLAAIANAGRHGVLVKSAVVMERLGTTTQVAFDKTGTLTCGTPEVTAVHPLPGTSTEALLTYASAAELPSEHPLATAVVAAARSHGITPPPATGFTAHPGRGVTAHVGDHVVQVGAPHHVLAAPAPAQSAGAGAGAGAEADGAPGVAEAGVAARAAGSEAAVRDVWRVVRDVRERGETAVVVVVDGRAIGVFGVGDRVRDEACEAVGAVSGLTGKAPVLLTGDNADAGWRLAGRVGIERVRAGLLPEEKVTDVRAMQDGGERVTVVGDGVNDAPALAAAHVGLAMGGGGADLTLHTADAVIVRDDLRTVPAVIALSRRARRVVAVNLVIAAAFIAGLVTWDLAGDLPLPLGVAGHEGSTIIVALNGLRLLRPGRFALPGK